MATLRITRENGIYVLSFCGKDCVNSGLGLIRAFVEGYLENWPAVNSGGYSGLHASISQLTARSIVEECIIHALQCTLTHGHPESSKCKQFSIRYPLNTLTIAQIQFLPNITYSDRSKVLYELIRSSIFKLSAHLQGSGRVLSATKEKKGSIWDKHFIVL